MKAFIPGRSGRLVAGEGLARGFLPTSSGENGGFEGEGVRAVAECVDVVEC